LHEIDLKFLNQKYQKCSFLATKNFDIVWAFWNNHFFYDEFAKEAALNEDF